MNESISHIPKSHLLKQVLDYSTNVSLTARQKERLIELVRKELQGLGDFEKNLEAKVDLLLNDKGKQNQTTLIDKEKTQLKSKGWSSKIKIEHSPELVFQVLRSFKFTNNKFPSFKYLLHGSEIQSLKEFEDQISEAELDFKKLRNIPTPLYKKLQQLIELYQQLGIEKVKEENIHPFTSLVEFPINLDKSRYQNLLMMSNGNYYNKFSSAIQGFKKQYRFERDEDTEASILEKLLKNVFGYVTHPTDGDGEKSFSEKDTSGKFCEDQLNYNLEEKAFFAWIPGFKGMLTWIITGMLKHTNMKGNKEFNSLDKKVSIQSYQEKSEINGNIYVVVEIIDTLSFVNRGGKDFCACVYDEAERHLVSCCDFEVDFLDESGKAWRGYILPRKECEVTSDNVEGLTYRFKFLKELVDE